MDKVKYVHILWQDEFKFNPRLVKLINDEKEVFDKEEHLFVTPHKKVYEEIKGYDNTYLDDSDTNLVNKYAPFCNWIIFHGHLNPLYGVRIKKENYKKLILRYWGSSLTIPLKKGQWVKNTARKVVNHLYLRKLRTIAGIGIANKVDEVALQEMLGNIPLYNLPYSMGKRGEILQAVQNCKKDDSVNVLLGHSAWPHDNHIEIIEKLSKYGDKIQIYIPLSYGNEEYKAKVDSYLENKSRNNIIPVREFMAYDDYTRLLYKMDIAILDGEKSYALGNVAMLLLFRKKIFLNRNGIIKKAFNEEKMPCCCVEEIDNMDFESFVRPLEYPEGLSDNLLPYSREKAVNSWKKILETFN